MGVLAEERNPIVDLERDVGDLDLREESFDEVAEFDEAVGLVDGGKRIATALGDAKLCILRNHGFLTAGRSVESAVGWFVMAERVAEVHVKAPNGVPISDAAAAVAATTLATEHTGWRLFQWLRRSLEI